MIPSFNTAIFTEYLPLSSLKHIDTVKDSIQTKDPVGSVLRTHLVCEQILTAWIYAACNRTGFLSGVQITFHPKLMMAVNLGLPEEAAKILRGVNKVRNLIAHAATHTEIDTDTVQSVYDLYQNHIAKQYHFGEEGSVRLLDEDNNTVELTVKPDLSKHHILAGVVALLIFHLLQITRKSS